MHALQQWAPWQILLAILGGLLFVAASFATAFWLGKRRSPKHGQLQKTLLIVFTWVMFALSVFYLFVVPVLAVTQPTPPSSLDFGFGLFLYLQLWMLIGEFGFGAFASIYGLRRKSLFLRSGIGGPGRRGLREPIDKPSSSHSLRNSR
jgi:hypothetical protein